MHSRSDRDLRLTWTPSMLILLLAFGPLVLTARAGADGTEPALKGFCPMSYFADSGPVKGKAEHATKYLGKTYHCSSAEAKAKFESDPTAYAPQFGGLCTTALGGSYGNRFWADPSVYQIVDGELYLFSSERALRAFERKPRNYVKQGADVYLSLSGYCPVSYHKGDEPVEGKESITVGYGAYGYRFKDEAAKAEFLKDPDRFVPAFGGFCAAGLARGKAHKGYYKAFAVIDGHTYLFWDAAAREEFLKNKEENLKAAAKSWEQLKDEHGVREAPSRKRNTGRKGG